MGSYINLRIAEKHQETLDTVSIILEETEGKIESFIPGQFLTFLFKENGKEIRRGYSISSTPAELPFLRVTIKKVHQNSQSSNCVAKLKVGQVIKSLPPLGNFTVKQNNNPGNKIIMFGAGSGITPLFSMLKHLMLNDGNAIVHLMYGNRNENSIIFKKELEELTKSFNEKFSVTNILSKPDINWNGLRGRITKTSAIEFLKSLGINDANDYEYYICGPSGMMNEVFKALEELNVNPKNIHRENFSTKILTSGESIDEVVREVTIFINGRKNVVLINPGETILQKALEAGLEVPNSCQIGECGTCRARLLSGQVKLVNQTSLSEHDIADGYILTCVGYPASDNVVVLYEDPFEI